MVVNGLPLWVDAKDEWPFGCQSWVSTTCWNCSISRLTRGTISSPLGTASAPPGQKSFCTSMTMSASSAVGVILAAMAGPPKGGGNYRRALGGVQCGRPSSIRHARAWPWHPRVCLQRLRLAHRNSWMVVPSTTMTKWGALTRMQPLGVPADVVADEGRHEVVRVVVARLHAQGQRHVLGLAGFGEQLRAQLRLQELIGVALVDQDVAGPAAARHQGAGIILGPHLVVGTEIGVERLLSPRHLAGRHDRREGRDRFEAVRVLHRDGERAVPAHGMAGDAEAREVDREGTRNNLRQLIHHVVVHLEVLRPRLLRGIEIEAGALAE